MAKHSNRTRSAQRPQTARKQDARVPPEVPASSQYLVRGILTLAGLILFFPLVADPSYYSPYIFPKSILFRLAVQFMALLYIRLALVSPSYRPRFNRIIAALLAYFAAILASSLPGVSASAWDSWFGDLGRMGGMISQLHLLAYFFVLTQTLKRDLDWILLFAAALFSGTLMGVTGLMQELHLTAWYAASHDPRTQGAAGNPNFYASGMLLTLCLAAWFLSRKEREKTHALVATLWLWLLAALDVFLVLRAVLADHVGSLGLISAEASQSALLMIALLLHAVVVGWYLMRRNAAVGNTILSLLIAFYFYSMYRSWTRGALVGLAGAAVITSALYLWGGRGRRVRRVCATAVALLILLTVFLRGARDSDWVRSHPALLRLAAISFRDPSTEYRIAAWRSAAKAMLERPVLGWGPENYAKAFDRHFPVVVYHQLLSEVWTDRAHNVILDVGTASGFAGLAGYLFFYGLVLLYLTRRWFRTKDPESLVFGGMILAYLFQGLFTFDTVNTDVTLYLVLAYVAWLYARDAGREQIPQKAPEARTRIQWPAWSMAGLATAMILSGTWYAVALPVAANRTLARAIAAAAAGKAQAGGQEAVYRPDAVRLFQEAAKSRTTGRYEARQEFANYVADLTKAPGVSPEQKIETLKLAIGPLEESIRQDPRSARHRMYLASLINRGLGVVRKADPQLAEELAKKSLDALGQAESLSPSRPHIFFERATTYSLMGSTDRAVTEIQKGIALNPRVKEPNVDLLCLYIAAGRNDEAEAQRRKMRELGLSLAPEDYRRVIRLYNDKKEYARMVDLYKEQLAQSPDDIVLLPRLAATYRELGEFELARRTALRAAELSSKIKAELRVFLDSLPPSK